MKKRKLLTLVGSICLILVLAALLLPACAKEEAPAENPIILGALESLTGSGAVSGITGRASLEIAVEEINAQGGILGRPIKLFTLDDRANPEQGLRQAKILVEEYNADILIGGGSSAVAMAVSDYAKSIKKLYIVLQPASSRITEELFHPYIVRIGQNTTSSSRAIALLCASVWGDKKVYQINHDYEYGHSCYDTFKEIYTELVPDVEWVGESWVPYPSQDFTPYLTDILASGAELVVDSIWGMDAVALSKQCDAFGMYEKVHWGGQVGGDVSALFTFKRGDPAPIGCLGAAPYPFWALDNPLSNNYWPQVFERVAILPPHAAAFGYTGPYALKAAMERAGTTTDTEKIIAGFEDLEIDSIVGKLKIRKIDHQAMWPQYGGVIQWEEGWDFPHMVDVSTPTSEQLYHSPEEIIKLREEYKE